MLDAARPRGGLRPPDSRLSRSASLLVGLRPVHRTTSPPSCAADSEPGGEAGGHLPPRVGSRSRANRRSSVRYLAARPLSGVATRLATYRLKSADRRVTKFPPNRCRRARIARLPSLPSPPPPLSRRRAQTVTLLRSQHLFCMSATAKKWAPVSRRVDTRPAPATWSGRHGRPHARPLRDTAPAQRPARDGRPAPSLPRAPLPLLSLPPQSAPPRPAPRGGHYSLVLRVDDGELPLLGLLEDGVGLLEVDPLPGHAEL